MSRCTKKNCPMVGVSTDCDLKDCQWRAEADPVEDIIYREDAIKALIEAFQLLARSRITALKAIESIPSVDIPHSDDWEKYSDKLWKKAYERGKAEAWRIAQIVFDSTVTLYEAEDVARMKGADDEAD